MEIDDEILKAIAGEEEPDGIDDESLSAIALGDNK